MEESNKVRECISDYDENGNIIHSIITNPRYEEWWKRDSKGNIIEYRNSSGVTILL
jgi:hypothetical protein